MPILKALPRTAKSNQSGGLNARVVDDVPKRLDRPRGAALVFLLAAPRFALAGAAGKKAMPGLGVRGRVHGYVPSAKTLVYLAESVSYPFEAGLRGAGARERDDVEAAGGVHAARCRRRRIELGG